jgi:transposase
MYHIRTTKTSSLAIAVQAVKYENRKLIIVKHFGSAHNSEELSALKKAAAAWIEKESKQRSLFPAVKSSSSNLIRLDQCQYLGVRYRFIYEVLSQITKHFGFCSLAETKMLVDLVIIRIVEPASKLRSLELLNEFFNIEYLRQDFYRCLPKFVSLKDQIERKTSALAGQEFDFDFSLVFYDVTTLYFETFHSDELRQTGFSKDNKAQQPQILIGLIVNEQGFPAAYEIFKGNKFEGHTLIPIISAFKKKRRISKLTVVADAAMLSLDNVKALKASGLSYIVGARVGNLSKTLIEKISSELNCQDGKSIRLATEHGQLICGFSLKRYRKDKIDMAKQLKKAEALLKNPTKTKRIKFIASQNKNRLELNNELIVKTKLLLGVKGYYTNLPETVNNSMIIQQYHNLWRVEQSFRVAKSDLEIRPIFHFKEQAIQTHILICFMALAICKYLEIKTAKSIKQIIRHLKNVTDVRIKNGLTGEEITLRSEITPEIKDILLKLGLPY